MLRYKNAKSKSNYVSVTVKSGVDLELSGINGLEETRLTSSECRLVFYLVPGEHMASASYDAGVINGKKVVGEVRVHYAYKDGRICVCEYDFKHKGYYEAPSHYTRPEFYIYEKSEETNQLCEKEPLFVISANRNVKHILSVENILKKEKVYSEEGKYLKDIFSEKNGEFSRALDKIQARLRTVYNRVSDALSGRGVFLSVHIDDFVESDENGIWVNGYMVDMTSDWYGKFINVVGSSNDKPPVSMSWIEYYSYKVCQDEEYYKTTLCSSHNYGLTCYIHGRSDNIGGHILPYNYTEVFEDNDSIQRVVLDEDAHVVNSGGNYSMLPICLRHNNHNKWNVAMCVSQDNPHTLLNLTGFIPRQGH